MHFESSRRVGSIVLTTAARACRSRLGVQTIAAIRLA
jgi:hypothetical protein